MNLDNKETTLIVSAVRELTAGTASEAKAKIRIRFSADLKDIDFDCSSLDFLDSSGLGALISVQKLALERGGKFRLLAPRPGILQVLELTRLHRVFEIVP